jgi:hypothetical protein
MAKLNSIRMSLTNRITVLCLIFVGACWTTSVIRQAVIQRRVVRIIINSGGQIWLRDDKESKFYDQSRSTPYWLTKCRYWLGNEFLSDVDEASIRDDAGLEAVRDLPDIECLDLWWSQITDRGLSNIECLHRLREITIYETSISDEGLKHIASLRQLESLGLAHTCVSDKGLEQLQGLSRLKWLDLKGTKVTVDGVRRLRTILPTCEILTDGDHEQN